MENTISNRVNMIRATLTWCTNNPAPTSGIPEFANAKATADTKLVLIDNLNMIAGGTSVGVTLDTNALRKAMSDIGFRCGRSLNAYAVTVGNNTLKLKVDFKKTDFKEMKKDEVDDVCQVIHDEANTNFAAAGGYGYTMADVTDLQTAISLYRTAMQNPRQAIISKSQAILQIKSISRNIIDISFKEIMDGMVQTLEVVNPNFVSSYFQAREIINIGSTTAKVRGVIRNQAGTYLVGAKFYLTITGQNQKVDDTTAGVGGKFGISNLPANDYDLYWSHPFYQTKTEINVHIAAGKEIKRNVTLLNLPPFTGPLNAGQQLNVLNNTHPAWTPGVTIKIKNTTTGSNIVSIAFFVADNAGDGYSGSNGSVLTNGQEETHTMTAAEFKAFLNVQNQSPFNGTYEITIL
ncbi:MAG: hypothetical protein POELPBGB_02083 [Bacteroidia bacterium]|nr:hypothetical protein [Bacteroidia bacterium]